MSGAYINCITCVVLALYFRTWTHTSDDSYIYQLSLVVSDSYCVLNFYVYFIHMRNFKSNDDD